MRTTTKMALAGAYAAFSALCATVIFTSSAFAHGNKGYSKYDKDRDPSSYSEQERAAMVQEKRSLKKKYLTRENSVATPTSPSNSHEAAIQRKAAMDKNAEEGRDTDIQ